MEEVVEEIDDEIERLVGERESTEAEESQEPVDREMLVPVIESLPESERKILLEEFSLSLAPDQRLELAERIVEGLSPDQRERFIEAVLGAVDVDTQKHIKERLAFDGKKAAVIAALLWFLDKVAEVFIQTPVEVCSSRELGLAEEGRVKALPSPCAGNGAYTGRQVLDGERPAEIGTRGVGVERLDGKRDSVPPGLSPKV